MKLVELLTEGAFVVKNKDGKEKRFKDANSPEAKEWAASSAPKKEKLEKYTQAWWEAKEDKDYDALMPWDAVRQDDIPSDAIQKAVKDLWGASTFDVSDVVGTSKVVVVDGVKCATRTLRVMVLHSKDDDLGNDEDVEETYKITFTRDPKNPKKFNHSLKAG